MTLTPGTSIGAYEVSGSLGAGGMGEVYRARDTKLDREVALKVLPEAFTSDPDRLARFEREARVLASLNHPNIGGIHGFEDSGDVRALVLELVEGPTLADRIARGPMPVDEALPVAAQIAEALEAAHEAGVVHRDLKPANIKVRDDGTVKVLDFGLAKALQPETGDASASMSPTMSLTAAVTQMGSVIGTAAYMSPEQARGKPVDKRADVWAFGCVLFEMLTGRRPFEADDVSSVLALVIVKDVDLASVPAGVPPRVRDLLARCLVKEPRDRLRDIGEARLALKAGPDSASPAASDEMQATAPAGPHRERTLWPWIAASVVGTALATAGVAWLALTPEAPSVDVARFTLNAWGVTPQLGPYSDRGLTIAPDGQFVVYDTEEDNRLYLRRVDPLVGAPLLGSESMVGPFVSPDGAHVGFHGVAGRSGLLQRVPAYGGPPTAVTEVERGIVGAVWGEDDEIIFGMDGSGLFTVPANGGTPEVLTTPESEKVHGFPAVIPGRRAVLFVRADRRASVPGVTSSELAVLDRATGDVRPLGLAGVGPRYLATGHLVFATREGVVTAVPFDVDSLEVTGDPVALLERVAVKPSGAAEFAVSDTGSFVYLDGEKAWTLNVERELVWVDRDGQATAVDAQPRNFMEFSLSPDGTRVATRVGGEGGPGCSTSSGTRARCSPPAPRVPVCCRPGRPMAVESQLAVTRRLPGERPTGRALSSRSPASTRVPGCHRRSPPTHACWSWNVATPTPSSWGS